MSDNISVWDNEPFKMPVWTIAKNYKGKINSFSPFPKCSDKNAYASLPQELKQQIINDGEEFLNYDYPVISATDYMKFLRTGNRVDYEAKYFARRNALCSLAIAECVEQKGRFTDDIINGIYCICEESGWQLPPHNSYRRSEPQKILPDLTKPVIDLFACETGALLACVSYVLGDILNEIEPCITKRIQYELESRIVTPYLNEHFWWMGKGYEKMCNWTPWCTQNVLITAFLGDFDEDIKRNVFNQASASSDYFLKDYADDGCCDEGAQYFRHAGLCLGITLDILNSVSNNAFSEIFEDEKIKNIFSFILNMHVDDKYYINFADCCAIAGRCTVQDYLLGKWSNIPSLMNFAAKDYKVGGSKLYTDEVYKISMYYRLQTIFNYEEITNYDDTSVITKPDTYYEGVGLFLVHSDNLCLAVKAGCNDDSHNHNDVGSITLYKNGKPLLIDIGVESYTAKTFSNRRYEIWTMQSGYHNLPTVNGFDQNPGKEYCATNISYDICRNSPFIKMDLSKAYPREAFDSTNENEYYNRLVTIDKSAEIVTIEDTTNSADVILNFITYEEPKLIEKSIKIGDLATMTFENADHITTEVLPIIDARLKQAWDHDLYRIRLRMTNGNTKILIH